MKVCLFCGQNSNPVSAHETCRESLSLFRAELSRTPDRDAWRVMRKFELGGFGVPPKRDGLPPKRGPGRRAKIRSTPPRESGARRDYIPRMLELLNAGVSQKETAATLTAEGFVSPQGKSIDGDTIRQRLYNLRKKAGAS